MNTKNADKVTFTSHSSPEEFLSDVASTTHANARMKQRGIKSQWVDMVLEYGREAYQKGKHTYSVSLNKAGIKKLQKKYGRSVELSKLRSLYVIIDEESTLVTCAYR